jgi:hypothetical protein
MNLLTKDLTGRTRTREVDHPYFGRIIRFCGKDASRNYWEAEFATPELPGPVSVTFTGSENGPEDNEVAFCRAALGDLDLLFERCRPAFAPEFEKRTRSKLPQNWQSAFRLDGFGVPRDGDPANDWDVCYFVEPVGRYFSAYFQRGVIARVLVDG